MIVKLITLLSFASVLLIYFDQTKVVLGSHVMYMFDGDALHDPCTVGSDIGSYEFEEECEQAKLFKRTGREVKTVGILTAKKKNRFVVCCIPRYAMSSIIETSVRFSTGWEPECKQYCTYDDTLDVKFRIIGGKMADAEEFKFMAGIGYIDDEKNKTDFDCGGTLLSDRFVLTAAHCCNNKVKTPYMVRLGRVSG